MIAAKVFDGDGHVAEKAESIVRFMPERYREKARQSGVFPPLDHAHNAFLDDTTWSPQVTERMQGQSTVGLEQWLQFMEATGIEGTVLYPTWGLACGKIIDPYWAVAATHAYNDWLYEDYLRRDKRFNAVGLLPMQNPETAVKELRRVVTELGMCGGFIPTNGLKAPAGSEEYWPVYAEAERLDCCIGFHGGCHDNFGLNQFNVFASIHALGHPIGIMISFVSMLFNGVFDRFPGLRVAYLEAGVSWFLAALERAEGSHEIHIPFDPEGRFIQLGKDKNVRQYVERRMRSGNIVIGVEGDEPDLAYAVKRFGSQSFVFSSDFPHEVTVDKCQEEIADILESEDLTAGDKEAILSGSAHRFYRV
jgi:uncharacterized protein